MSSTEPTHPRRAAGFSLLEVLVGFTVAALALGLLFQIYGRGAHALVAAEGYARAVVVAQSLLASAGVDDTLEPGETEGETEDGWHWRRQVEPHEDPELEALLADEPAGEGARGGRAPQRLALVEVRVAVDWHDGLRRRSLELVSLRSLPGP
jgi:general secretion pathway protein I